MRKVALEGKPFLHKHKLEQALSCVAVADMGVSFELIFASEEQIRAVNAAQRGVDSVTDVLSFPSLNLQRGAAIAAHEHGESIDEKGRLLLGSVVVCKKRAREQAKEYGHSYSRELCYLVTHGVLHCLGYDHETDEDKHEMRQREEEVMQKLGLGRKEA